jgi:hypothetical protein
MDFLPADRCDHRIRSLHELMPETDQGGPAVAHYRELNSGSPPAL